MSRDLVQEEDFNPDDDRIAALAKDLERKLTRPPNSQNAAHALAWLGSLIRSAKAIRKEREQQLADLEISNALRRAERQEVLSLRKFIRGQARDSLDVAERSALRVPGAALEQDDADRANQQPQQRGAEELQG